MDERTRYELHQWLDEVLGVEQAVTLMSHLPPGGATSSHGTTSTFDCPRSRRGSMRGWMVTTAPFTSLAAIAGMFSVVQLAGDVPDDCAITVTS